MNVKIVKKMTISLIITAIVIAISISIMTVNQAAGIILMMLYSSWMVVKSSNKEMPLGKLTAILPGVMSLAVFFVMLGLIGVREDAMPLIGIGLGIIPGWLMARGHKVYKKNGILYAKRTFFYVFIWAISILFTQGSTLARMREITDFSFLLSGFSTAMMVVLSLILFRKSTNKKNGEISGKYGGVEFAIILIILFVSTPLKQVNAIDFHTSNESVLTQKIGEYVFEDTLFFQFSSKMIDFNIDRTSYDPGEYHVMLRGDVFGPDRVSNSGSRAGNSKIRNILIPDSYSFQLIDKHIYQKKNTWSSLDKFKKDFIQFKTNGCNFSIDAFYQQISTRSGKGHMCYEYHRPGDQTIKATWSNDRWIVIHKSKFDWSDSEQIRQQQRTIVKSAFNSIIAKLLSINGGNNQAQYTPSYLGAQSDLRFSNDDTALAGVVAAFLMLLASLLLNISMIAAQEGAISDTNAESNPPLFDPYDDEQLPEEDGKYWAGREGDEGKWMSREEAERYISELHQEKSEADRRREQELDMFEEQNERDRTQRKIEREQRLRDEGNIYDEEQDAWVRDPKVDESRSPTDEYYDRGDYIQSHLSELSKEQRKAAKRILDRIGWNAPALNPDGTLNNEDINEKNQENMIRLSHVIDNLLTGKHQSEMAEEEYYVTYLEHGKKIAEKIADAGEMASTYLETQFLPTKGAISGFVFQGIQSADKGVYRALYDGSVSSLANVVDNRLGDSRKGDVLWNAMTGGLTSSAETGAKGGDAEDMMRSGLFSFLLSGVSEHAQNYATRNDGKIFDFNDWWRSRSNIDIHTRTSNIEGPDISSRERSEMTEEDIMQRIKESIANNESIQRAEATADKLRRGENVTFEDRSLTGNSKDDWYARDLANGQISPQHIRSMKEFVGIDRTRYMEQAIDSNKYPELDRIDRGIRDAWTEARINSNNPDPWSQFQSELKARNISDADFNTWEEVSLSGPAKEDGAAVMDTVVHNSNSSDIGSDTVINHHQDNTFVGSDDTFVKHDTDDTIVESNGGNINNTDTVITEKIGKIDVQESEDDET